MEGRARDRAARQGWAWWVLPLAGTLLAQVVEGLTDAHRAPYLVGGLAAGSAWQVLYRRDPADRLVFPVVLALVTLGWALVRGAPIEVSEDTVGPEATLLYLGGLLAALVLTEQHLRRRDHRDDRGLSGAAPARSRGSARR